MSKMKEIDSIAQGVADHCWEILYDSVAWQIADILRYNRDTEKQ